MIAAAFARWCVTPVRESMSQWAAINLVHTRRHEAGRVEGHFSAVAVDNGLADVAADQGGHQRRGAQKQDRGRRRDVVELGQQSIVSENKEQELGTRVSCKLVCLPLEISFLVKSCLYRFVREAL